MIYTLLKAVLAVLGAYLIGLHLLGIYVSVLWIAEKIDLQKMSRFAKPFGIAVCALLAIVVCGSCGIVIGTIQNVTDLHRLYWKKPKLSN